MYRVEPDVGLGKKERKKKADIMFPRGYTGWTGSVRDQAE